MEINDKAVRIRVLQKTLHRYWNNSNNIDNKTKNQFRHNKDRTKQKNVSYPITLCTNKYSTTGQYRYNTKPIRYNDRTINTQRNKEKWIVSYC